MMENVIEKHYVPTSGSGLDANLVAALMNNNNKSLDPATVALLRDNDKGLETAALANGGGMFGGAAMWNNPFMYLVWMWIMRWMNGNGEWGNGQGLANQLNNDANTNLTIRAIDGNRDALRELATNLNCDFNTLNSAICGIKGAIDKVGCDVGFSAERVINAIQMGDSNISSKMQDCCCTTQRSIDAVNLNLTKMSYEDQLAVQAQTNQLMTAINNGFCNVGQQIGNQTVAMQAGFQGIKDLFTQQKIDTLQNLNLQYSNQLSQLAQTAAIRELIDPIKKELSDIQCGLPKQPVPAIPVSCAYPYAGYGAGYAGYSGCGSCA